MEDRRAAAAEDLERWAAAVRRALEEHNLSINAAAKQAGISPGALQSWLKGAEPSPRAMEDLARVIGLQHLHLVYLLGWLPKELSDVPVRLEATEKLREALSDAQSWVETASGGIGLTGPSLITNGLLRSTADWEATVRHAERGKRHRTPYVTNVAFARINRTASATAKSAAQDTEADRAEILESIRDPYRRTSAQWRPAEPAEGWEKRPDLVLSVPLMIASRPRERFPNLEVPASILVVGIPFAGGSDVASLLATGLQWAYNDVGTVARERFGATEGEAYTGAQVEVAKRLLQDPALAGRLMVWSYDSVAPINKTITWLKKKRNTLPLVVFLRAGEQLIRYSARATGGDPAEMEMAQIRVRRELEDREDPLSYRILDVPDLSIDSSSHEDQDILFDAYVDLAFQAAEWLNETYHGPSLDEAPGVLGDLWRRAKAQEPTAVERSRQKHSSPGSNDRTPW
jgi:transcriptional regulator with XRE-family HTH domain